MVPEQQLSRWAAPLVFTTDKEEVGHNLLFEKHWLVTIV
jgi:hypothetical protein